MSADGIGKRTAKQALEAFNDAFARGDVAGLSEVFTEDAVFEANGMTNSTGGEAIAKWHGFVFQVTGPRSIELHRVAESGDSVLAEATFHGVMKPTGAVVRLAMAVSVTVRDGRIVRFGEYFDMVPKRNFDGEIELGAGDLLRRFWELFASGDTDAAAELLSWDVVYEGPFSEHPVSGIDAVRQVLAAAPAERALVGVELRELAEDGATALAEGWQIQENPREGDEARFPFVSAAEARAGKIVRLSEYFDTSRFREPEARDLGAPAGDAQ